MNNTNTPSHYFHVHYGNEDQRIFHEDLLRNGKKDLATALLEFSQEHPECPINKITSIERVNYKGEIFFNLEDEAAELEFEVNVFMAAVRDGKHPATQEDLFTILTALSNLKKKLNGMDKMIGDQLVFFEYNLERRN